MNDFICIFVISMGNSPMRNRKLKNKTLSMSSIKNITMWSGKTCGNVIAFTEGANDKPNWGFHCTSYM